MLIFSRIGTKRLFDRSSARLSNFVTILLPYPRFSYPSQYLSRCGCQCIQRIDLPKQNKEFNSLRKNRSRSNLSLISSILLSMLIGFSLDCPSMQGTFILKPWHLGIRSEIYLTQQLLPQELRLYHLVSSTFQLCYNLSSMLWSTRSTSKPKPCRIITGEYLQTMPDLSISRKLLNTGCFRAKTMGYIREFVCKVKLGRKGKSAIFRLGLTMTKGWFEI